MFLYDFYFILEYNAFIVNDSQNIWYIEKRSADNKIINIKLAIFSQRMHIFEAQVAFF